MGDNILRIRLELEQKVVKHIQNDLNGWDCSGNNVSSGLCSSSVIKYIESLGKQVIIDGTNVSVIDSH